MTISRRVGVVVAGFALCLAVITAAGCSAVDTEDEGLVADVGACEGAAADGELSELSCLTGTPVNDDGAAFDGEAVELGKDEASAKACNTYRGPCTGWGGCSRAIGGGWQYTLCGPFLYAWMTICDGQPTGWGGGACAW